LSKVRCSSSLSAAVGAALVLVAIALVLASAPRAGADAPVAIGWWSQASALPPPPDVSADGLYVQGGPGGPVAISALRFQLPTGTNPDQLVLIPNGVASPSAAVQVCPLKPESLDFQPAQNGAWSDAPAYDCSGANAIVGEADDSGALTFKIGTLPQDGILGVAVIATGATDRVPIAKPDASTLTTTPSAIEPTPSGGETFTPTYDPGTSSAPSYSAPAPAASPSVALPTTPAPAVTPPSSGGAAVVPSAPPGPDAPLAIAAPSPHDLATRLGGLVAIAILVAALIAYSLGYGLLGGRFVDV
jgi:hypothetical protein